MKPANAGKTWLLYGEFVGVKCLLNMTYWQKTQAMCSIAFSLHHCSEIDSNWPKVRLSQQKKQKNKQFYGSRKLEINTGPKASRAKLKETSIRLNSKLYKANKTKVNKQSFIIIWPGKQSTPWVRYTNNKGKMGLFIYRGVIREVETGGEQGTGAHNQDN